MVSEKTVTAEDRLLRDYELMVIFSTAASEEALEATLDSVNRFITGKGGVVSEVKRWGKRKLAYPIKHFAEGNYTLFNFKMKPVYSKELESNLRISEGVIRHLLVKLGD